MTKKCVFDRGIWAGARETKRRFTITHNAVLSCLDSDDPEDSFWSLVPKWIQQCLFLLPQASLLHIINKKPLYFISVGYKDLVQPLQLLSLIFYTSLNVRTCLNLHTAVGRKTLQASLFLCVQRRHCQGLSVTIGMGVLCVCVLSVSFVRRSACCCVFGQSFRWNVSYLILRW